MAARLPCGGRGYVAAVAPNSDCSPRFFRPKQQYHHYYITAGEGRSKALRLRYPNALRHKHYSKSLAIALRSPFQP